MDNSVSATISASITYTPDGIETDMDLKFNNSIDINAVIDNFTGNIFPSEFIRLLNGISIYGISWIYDPKKEILVRINLSDVIDLDFGIVKMQLELERLYIKYEARSKAISGVINIQVAIGDKLIDEIDNVARALKEHFNKTTDDIAMALLNAGETVEQVGKALKAIGSAPGEVVKILGETLAKLGREAEAVVDDILGVGKIQLGKVAEDAIGKFIPIL